MIDLVAKFLYFLILLQELSKCNEAPDETVDGLSEAIEQCQPNLEVYAAGPESKANMRTILLCTWVGLVVIALW